MAALFVALVIGQFHQDSVLALLRLILTFYFLILTLDGILSAPWAHLKPYWKLVLKIWGLWCVSKPLDQQVTTWTLR